MTCCRCFVILITGVCFFLYPDDSPASENSADPAGYNWERQASLAAVKRYQTFLQKNPRLLQRDIRQRVVLSGDSKTDNRPKKGVILFQRNTGKIRRHDFPEKAELIDDRVAVSAASDEWESLQMGVWTLKDIASLSVHLSEFKKDETLQSDSQVMPVGRLYFVYNVLTRKETSAEISADMDIDPEKKRSHKNY